MRVKNNRKMAWFLVLVMVCSMLVGVPVSAEGEEVEEEVTGVIGLVVKDEIEWNEDVPNVNDEQFSKEAWAAPKEEKLLYLAYLAEENGEETAVTAENITVTCEDENVNDEDIVCTQNEKNNSLVMIQFPACGEYVITYTGEGDKNKSITVYVEYPEVGFYTSQTQSVDSYIADNRFAFSDVENGVGKTFYMILKSGITLAESTPVLVRNHEDWDTAIEDEEVIANYITYEELESTPGIYEMVVRTDRNFTLEVTYVGEDSQKRTASVDVVRSMDGLVVKDWIDWNDESPYVNEEAQFSKEAWAAPKEEKLLYLAYLAEENGEETAVTAENITVTCEDENVNDEDIVCTQNEKNNSLVMIQFPACGEYVITYTGEGDKNKSITVYVEYPEVGFYTSQTQSVDSYIADNRFAFSDEENGVGKTFYMILKSGITLAESTPVLVRDHEDWDTAIEDEEAIANYITYEAVSDVSGVYKMVVQTDRNFTLEVTYVGEDSQKRTASVDVVRSMDGLVVKDWIDWNDEGPYINGEAEFLKETGAEMSGTTLYFAYKASEDAEATTLGADELTVLYNGEAAGDLVNIAPNGQNEKLVDIQFRKTGDYTISYTPENGVASSITIHVSLPLVGFYKTNELSEEGYIWDSFEYTAGADDSLYLIINSGDDAAVSDTEINVLDYYSNAIQVEEITANKAYKIIIKDELNADFPIQAKFMCQWGEGEPEPIIHEIVLHEKEMRGRRGYTDGAKHTGYTACYITEQEYKMGGPFWNNNSPIFWAHADTVQGVIDKLSAVANGEEVLYELVDYDGVSKPDKSKTVTSITNTGYIYVVVSHFGNVTLTPQYVSSSGNMKGIVFASGRDIYYSEHDLEDGFYIEDNIYNLDTLRGILEEEAMNSEAYEDADDKDAYVAAYISDVIPSSLADVTYVSRYKNAFYLANEIKDTEKNQRYFTLGMAITYDTGKETIQEEAMLRYLNDVELAEVMDAYKYPEMHVNVYCDMKFFGRYEKLSIGFKEGKDYSASILNDYRNANVTYSRASLEGNRTKEYETTIGYEIDDKGTVEEEDITVWLYDIESETTTSGSYEGTVEVAETPEPNAMTELTQAQKDAIEESKKLTVDMKAEGKAEADVDTDVVNAIKDVAKDEEVAGIEYVDISVSASVEGVDGATQITELKAPMDVTIDIPNRLHKKGRKFKVVRHHHGKDGKKKTEWIDAELSEDGKKLRFKTDRFSTYAIVYDSEDVIVTEKSNFDMSKVAWNYTSAFTYDGTEKKVELTGIPEGLTAVYTGNAATEPGSYTAKVTFTYDDTKYNAPDVTNVKDLTWEIVKKEEVPPTLEEEKGSGESEESKDSEETKEPEVKVGIQKTISGAKYKVTSTTDGKKTVSYVGPNKKASSHKIPSSVKIDGVKYTVTAISNNAFSGNTKMTSVTIPSSITKIGNNAFKGCTKLTKVTIPKNVTEIGSNAFYNCKKLSKVTFKGTKIKKIGNGAFRKCSSLKSVTIPKNVTEIGKDAFRDCKKLSKVTFKGTKIKKIGKNAFKNIASKPTIKVPKSKKSDYKKLLKQAGYKKTVK